MNNLRLDTLQEIENNIVKKIENVTVMEEPKKEMKIISDYNYKEGYEVYTNRMNIIIATICKIK